MPRSWWAKLALLITFLITAVFYVIPTIANLDPEKTNFPVKKKVNLGLDLQGGLYMVLGVDFNKVFHEVIDRQVSGLRENLKSKNITVQKGVEVSQSTPDDPKLPISFDPAQRDEIHKILKRDYWTLRITNESAGKMELGLSREYRTEIRQGTLSQSIEVIRNRVDEFGVAEPIITSQGEDRIVVELPGIREVERAKELIGRTAKLEFKLVADKQLDQNQLFAMVAELEKSNNVAYREGQKFSEYVQKINELAKGKIPPGTIIAFERSKAAEQTVSGGIPYLLNASADITGHDLQDATVQIDPESQRPAVGFELTPQAAETFAKLTGEHIGERLAIVLDNIVHSAPVIQGQIPGGRGQISLGSGGREGLLEEAKDLAIVLRAGALPAQLEFQQEREIGPSLGEDSIQKGAKAGIIGCLLVFAFIVFYYRVSGAVAVFSLTLNALFILAILIGIDATLTLPGIAGIALTIGMAVDSNVIIFERIRDELMEGKPTPIAVESGFAKAFSCIFDANITHGIVAVILLMYGTGPIKGFAITLLIGIATTLFCAVTVCKLIFDGYLGLSKQPVKSLSI
ncbi:MAG: protein translocase subunit SecD [Bdellovibrionota bacterium]